MSLWPAHLITLLFDILKILIICRFSHRQLPIEVLISDTGLPALRFLLCARTAVILRVPPLQPPFFRAFHNSLLRLH